MNLVTDDWIPVVDTAGEKRFVSLNEVIGNGQAYVDLVVTPPQRIALYRLLICIVQAALDGPLDENDWRNCGKSIGPMGTAYLNDWKSSFELYGDKPFLQVPNLEINENPTVDKLDFGLAAGNNPTIFDQASVPEGRDWPDHWRALMLLTYQCFSPGGRIGVSKWGGVETSGNGASEHAPAIERSALHTYLRGECIRKTIHLNLVTKEQVQSLPNSSWGRPVWEDFPCTPNAPSVDSLVSSYLGRLVPISRAILMKKGERLLTLCNGLAYPKIPEGRDTTSTVVLRKKGTDEKPGLVGVSLARHPWRELASVLSLSSGGVNGGPLALSHFASLEGEILDVWCGGMAAAGNGKILDTAEWNFSVETDMLGDIALNRYQRGAQLAKDGEFALKIAVKNFYKEFSMDSKQAPTGRATTIYWDRLDSSYQSLIDVALKDEESLNDGWYPVVHKAAVDAFNSACPAVSARQLQAHAKSIESLRVRKLEE